MSSGAIEKALANSNKVGLATVLDENGKPEPWYYCLDKQHSKDLVSSARLFQYHGDGCPVCPTCKTTKGQPKAVAANPAEIRDGEPQIPGYLIALDQRLNPE